MLVVNPQREIEERRVKLGIETPSKIEVLAGLSPNDLVIVGNRSQFKPGQAVQPKLVDVSESKGS